MLIHLITYGDNNFKLSKKRLLQEATNTGWFDTVTAYNPDDLDKDFKEDFKDILKNKRGGGYWIWKPYIIKKKLEEINEGDILIYLDAGCSINIKGKDRLNDYIELLNNSNAGIISFQMSHEKEKIWTTKEIFKYFNIDPKDSTEANTGQFIGGIRIMKKNENIYRLIEKELEIYKDNQLLVTDFYNNNQEDYFKENRHEQSIFSIIRKTSKNPIILEDETYFKPFGNSESLKYPFWATRKWDNLNIY